MFTNDRYLYLPSNLDLEELCANYSSNKYPGVTTDKLAFICHSIIQVSIKYRNSSDEINAFLPLYSAILKSKIRDYQTCKQLLIDAGVIECKEVYYVGQKSKGFRFCDKYFGQGFKHYAISDELFLKYQKGYSPKDVNQSKLNSKAKHLFPYLINEKLKLDKQNAFQYLEVSCSLHLQELKKPAFQKIDQKLKDSINDRYDKYKMLLEQFEQCCMDYKVDSSGFRLFTVLTNMKKELRNFITYDSKPLLSLDLKCSQPFLTLILFDKDFYSSNVNKGCVTLKKIHPELYDHLRLNGNLKDLKQLSSANTELPSNILDVRNYRTSIVERDYYSSLADIISKSTGKYLSRSDAKEQSHYILFGNPMEMHWAAGYKAFCEAYPNVVKVFNILKSRSYKDLAILLQRVESDLVISKITKQFADSLPDIPIYTIHDSIITVNEYVPELLNNSNQIALKHFGVEPKFEYEEWTESKAFDNINEIKFSKAERKLITNMEDF